MAYEPLEKLFYRDASSNRFAENERLARQRLEDASSFRLGYSTQAGELFVAVPRELSLLNEQVLSGERRVSGLLSQLSVVARAAFVRSLVAGEVVSTNDLEGVHSTRRQISELLQMDVDSGLSMRTPSAGSNVPDSHRRFRELARLYLGLNDPDRVYPTTPEDVRRLYDLVMSAEPLDSSERPDGKLFRRGGVQIIGRGSKVLHEGVYPEERIIDGVRHMLTVANSPEIPSTYGAIAAHYIFEYVHPFYDGNGRCGRYLLALQLGRTLSVPTTLSVSRVIAQNRSSYYRAFNDAEKKLNHAELTFFVMTILEDVLQAQGELIESLAKKNMQLEASMRQMRELASGASEADGDAAAHRASILELLVQLWLYAAFPDASLVQVADYLQLGTQQTRKYLSQLQDSGYVVLRSARPLRFQLSDQVARELGLPASDGE